MRDKSIYKSDGGGTSHIFKLIYKHDYEKALVLLKQNSRAYPADIDYGIARCLEGLGKNKEAIKQYKKNIENYPHHKANYSALYGCLHHTGALDEAASVIKQMSNKISETEALLAEARYLRYAGLHFASLEKYRHFIEQYHDNKVVKLEMLLTKDRYESTQETLLDLENFIKREKIPIQKNSHAYLHYAVRLQQLKQYDKALEIIKDLIKEFPEDPHPYATFALTTEFQSDSVNAEKRYLKMLAKFPLHENGHLLYAMF